MQQYQEGQRLKGSDGNIYVVQGGVPRLATGGPNVVMPAVQDPKMPFEVTQSRNQAAASQFAPQKAQADATIAQAEAANAIKIAEAQARKAEADARIAETNARTGKSQLSPDIRAQAINAYHAAQQLRGIADGLSPKFAAGPGATTGVEGVLDFLPYTANQQFDTAANKARGFVGTTLGFTGGQLNTEREAEKSIGPFIPESSDRDAKIVDKIDSLHTLADEAEAKAIAVLGGRPDINGNVTPATEAEVNKTPALVNTDQPQDKVGFSTNGYSEQIDPILKGISGRLGKMVSAGASDATIMEFLKKNGVDPGNTNIQSVLQYRKSDEFKKWQRANPGKAYPIGSDFYTNKVPLSAAQDLGNKAAQSGLGAGVIGFAQGATGNRLDDIATALGGDGEAINTGIQLSRANNPGMSFGGDLAGQAFAQYMLNRVPGFRALPNSMPGRIADDAIYGAYAGQGEGDTLGGIAANTIGGAGGRGLGAVGGLGLRGIDASNSLRYLNNADVPLTVGQIGRGTNSTVGNAIGGIEERAAGLPIFDAIIGSGRRRGDVGFNREMFRQIDGSASGNVGIPGLAEARNARNNAYSFLDNATLARDPTYDAARVNLTSQINTLPDFNTQVGKKIDLLDSSFDASGNMTGRDFQSSIRSLRKERGKIASQPFGDDAANVLGQAETDLSGLVQRQLPNGMDDLANANAIHARYKTAQGALKGRVAQRNGVLTDPTTLNDVSIRGAEKFGGIDNAMVGQRPFFDLTQAGMDVMPNLTPDSGTAGRSLFYAALPSLIGGATGASVGGAVDGAEGAQTGGGIGLGSTMIPTLALAALYSKGGQKGIQKALLGPRPQWAKDLDNAIQANPALRKLINKRVAGMFGSAVARDLTLYPELEQ